MPDTHEIAPGLKIVEPGLTHCDGCGQDNKNIALTIHVNAEDAEAFAPYEADRDYNICYACWLRALGVPLPIGPDKTQR
jgi:hypothetical protein